MAFRFQFFLKTEAVEKGQTFVNDNKWMNLTLLEMQNTRNQRTAKKKKQAPQPDIASFEP